MGEIDAVFSEAPEGSTHYSRTVKNNFRYFKKDNDNNWLTFITKRYPLGWQPVGIFEDLTKIKPLY